MKRPTSTKLKYYAVCSTYCGGTHEIMTIITKERLSNKMVRKIAFPENVIKVFQPDQYNECVEFAKTNHAGKKFKKSPAPGF